MRTGSVTSSVMPFVFANAIRVSSQRADASLLRLATGQRINSAADDPSAIPVLASVQSKYNEAKIMSQIVTDPGTLYFYKAVRDQLGDLATQTRAASTALTGGSNLQATDLVATIRHLAGTTVNDIAAYAGDPLKWEKIPVNHARVDGSVTGTTITGPVTFDSAISGTNGSEIVYDPMVRQFDTTFNLNNSSSPARVKEFTLNVTQESLVRLTNTWPPGTGNKEQLLDSSGNVIESITWKGSPYNNVISRTLAAGSYTFRIEGSESMTARAIFDMATAKRTVGLELDGRTYQIGLLTGTSPNLTDAVGRLKSAIESQTNLRAGTDFTLDVVNNQVVAKSLKQGAGSAINFTGSIATAMGITGGTRVVGADAYTEITRGPNDPLTVQIGGRSLTLENLTKVADTLQAAIDTGNNATIQSTLGALATRFDATSSASGTVLNLLGADKDYWANQVTSNKARLDQIQQINTSDETNTLAKNQVQAQQAAWAFQLLMQHRKQQTSALFGMPT